MADVFFKGFGSWFAWGEEGAHVIIVPSYGASGVFSLNVSDEITYNHTGNLPLNVSMLHPTNHPDSEFSRLENLGKTLKMGELGDIGGKYTANNCFFVMDEEQPRDKILVIASPYQAIPQAEAVGDAGAVNGDFNAKIREDRYKDRDLDAANWINDSNPNIESMTATEIHTALKARNHTLWNKGFPDWNRKQEIWPKKKAGRKQERQLMP